MMGTLSFVASNRGSFIEESKSKKDDVFKYIWDIFDIIKRKDPNYKENLDNILEHIDKSKLSFIVWALNHNLAYNPFTRKFLDLFTLVSNTFMSNEEYIYFYVNYMIKNGIDFPKFMPWYKININKEDIKYKEWIKEVFELDDDDLEDVLEYLRNENISIRDICLNLL